MANNAGAVIDDPAMLRWAHAVYEAYGDLDVTGEGLTVEQLRAACQDVGPGTFDSRISVFKQLHLLQPPQGRDYHRRLHFNTTGVAALLVFDKLRLGTGIQEILFLLDQTRRDILDGVLVHDDVLTRLTTLRRALSISTGELIQLRDRPVEELLHERRNRRGADRMLPEAKALVQVVETRFPELSPTGSKLIAQALRYSAAVSDLVDRLLRAVTAVRDFSMLLPEQYRTAALRTSADDLSGVFARMVFDPASVLITPDEILSTIAKYRPPEPRQRAPRSPELPPDHDPVRDARQRRSDLRERRQAVLRLRLRGNAEVDLTAEIENSAWPDAIRMITDLLAASGDRELGFTVRLSDELRVHVTGSVSYVTPIHLTIVDGRHHD
ncbi:hypothetical protein [Lentzea sp. E54]|uniref:hypothetical protein n=1 Tax=Lentzea xerophila TaxID=3435883 RepID=UPI003DA3B80E